MKCCIANCKNCSRNTKLHVLPKDKEIRKKWCAAISREDLIEVDPAKRPNYRVCDIHFAADSRFANVHNRSTLKYNAYPTLHLSDTLMQSSEESAMDPLPGTSSSFVQYSVGPETLMQSIEESAMDLLPGTSNSCVQYFEKSDRKRNLNLLRSVGVHSSTALSPTAYKMYRVAVNLRRVAKRLEYKNLTYKSRILKIEKYAKSNEFLSTKMNATSALFFISQMRLQNKKSKGRRFTFRDKIFALALLKQSPKGYRLLQQVFALPSRRTLLKVLNKVPFQCGINNRILDSLRCAAMKMKNPLHRICTLMFDEMALQPSLSYNSTTDSVEGFLNCGESNKLEFADHAMVFMIRGVHINWKQPVAYFFTRGAMTSVHIIRNIKVIVNSLHNAGLSVVATVCDQHAANVAAVNTLIRDTDADYIRKRSEKRHVGFELDGKIIIPLFDPPHLLKGIRNNFLDNRVKFSWKRKDQVGSWADIVQLYQMNISPYYKIFASDIC